MKRMLMRKPASKMAGITLLETMFAIAVGALILIAAAIFFTTSKQSQNVSKTVTDIQTIVAQTNSYIAPGGTSIANINKGGNSVATLIAAGYLPTGMVDPWGNTYTGTVNAGSSDAVNEATNVMATTIVTVNSFKTGDSTCLAIQQALTSATSVADTSQTNCSVKFNL